MIEDAPSAAELRVEHETLKRAFHNQLHVIGELELTLKLARAHLAAYEGRLAQLHRQAVIAEAEDVAASTALALAVHFDKPIRS